jgi:hypothetical protein
MPLDPNLVVAPESGTPITYRNLCQHSFVVLLEGF